MSGDVRNRSGLPGCVRGVACCPAQVSSGAHRMTTGRACLHHLHVASYPGTSMLDRLSRTWVRGTFGLEEREDMFRTQRSPQRKQVVIQIGERPAAADRHEP